MQKIWQKDYTLDKQVEAYCFSESAALDNKLITYDVICSLAHAKMLASVGAINGKEFKQLEKYLLQILKFAEKSQFIVVTQDEDVHTKVENYLIEKLGNAGKKLHTGRSRNDQVLGDLKLYTKDQLLLISTSVYELADTFLDLAKKHEFVPMPGYTHMQKAMPSSVGLWAASFAESLMDDLELLKSAYECNDQSPLGAGAAYGVPVNIDRQLTAKLLGFGKIQNNPLYAISSRLKVHLAAIQAVAQIMLTLSRFAADLLLFTTVEFDFFELDKKLTSGSSIMPQKQNLDAMEILRAKSQKINGYQQIIGAMLSGLPSGYNADFAESKGLLINAAETTLDSLKVCKLFVQSIEPKIENMASACTSELYATHAAYQLVSGGTSFRDAYKSIATNPSHVLSGDKLKVLRSSKHIGGSGNLGLAKVQTDLKVATQWWQAKEVFSTNAINKLLGVKGNEK